MKLNSNSGETEIIKELHDMGIDVANIWDLIDRRGSYDTAIPRLVELLPTISEKRTKEGLVRALTVRGARGLASHAIVFELKKPEMANPDFSSLGWALGNALSVVVTPSCSVFDELEELLRDRRLGSSRQMITEALAKTRDPRAEDVLIDLLSDQDLTGHAIWSLGYLKSQKARNHIETYLDHPNRWIRKEAKRALGKIDKDSK